MPEIRMNSLKSFAMNCGPLSEMIRGRASGYFSFSACKMIWVWLLYDDGLPLEFGRLRRRPLARSTSDQRGHRPCAIFAWRPELFRSECAENVPLKNASEERSSIAAVFFRQSSAVVQTGWRWARPAHRTLLPF